MTKSASLAPAQALAEERAALGEGPHSALCISGGGIRSATFALGVVQGLAERGLLGKFDYLSTVSGGGYVGAMLSCWAQRAGGMERVTAQLMRNAPPVPEGAPDPIEHLREYNSYLSPKLGFFSVDTWTLAATVLRNMMLNWLVFVPLLMAALMLPRLVLSLARLGETFALFYGTSPSITREMFHFGLPLLAGGLFAFAVFNAMRYLPGVGGVEHSEADFLKLVFAPAVCAAFVFVTNDAWFTGGDLTRAAAVNSSMVVSFGLMCGSVIAAGMLGWAAYLITAQRRQKVLAVTAAIAVMSASAGAAAWFLAGQVYPLVSWPVYTIVAAPLLLLAVLLAGCLFVGLSSGALQDEDREWMSRAGAWMLLFVVGWSLVCALVLIVPTWAFALPGWGKSLLGGGGALAGWITALARSNNNVPGAPKRVIPWGLFAAPVFILTFLTGLSILTDWLLMVTGLGAHSDYLTFAVTRCPACEWWDHRGLLEGTRWESAFVLGAAFLLFSWLLAKFVNINNFSLHDMYRNRLVRAYLGASNNFRNANRFTGFAPGDDVPMHELATIRPFHVVNVALNLVAGERLAWQQRKAASFTLSPLHCGSFELGFRPSRDYAGGVSLGTAITISGAAASPNMGYHSTPWLAFIMTLFNARLGAWLGNPGSAGGGTWRKAGPTSAFGSLVNEAFGLTNDTNEYVYLSDGGHFENLALYEMVRRRCRYIVVSDGGCDAGFTYGDLGNALRKIRIDLKVPIEFDDRYFQPFRKKDRRFAVARIGYSAVDADEADGWLLYIKPMMRFDEPPDVMSYQADHPEFPHQSTADQFFDESQTEAYRALGLHTMDEVCGSWDRQGGFAGLFDHLQSKAEGTSMTAAAG